MHHFPDRIAHTTAFGALLEREIAQWFLPMKDRSDDPSHPSLKTMQRTTETICWILIQNNIRHPFIIGARCSSVVRVFAHGAMGRRIDPPLSYFLFQPVHHDWCNKGRGMCYPVYGMVHIKEPLLLIGKNSPCGGSRFSLSLSEWSFIICLTPYNRN